MSVRCCWHRFLAITSSGLAATLNVPTGYPTIPMAIDAASSGDKVVIAGGVYTGAGNRNLDFGGKAITVRSASGDPAMCIIACKNDGRLLRSDPFRIPRSLAFPDAFRV